MTKCYVNPRFGDERRLKEFLESLPQSFEQDGRLLWNGRNKIKAFDLPSYLGEILSNKSETLSSTGETLPDKGETPLKTIVVKRFKHLDVFQKIVYVFRKHKARKAFLNGIELVERGVDTPLPVAAVEVKAGPWLNDAFYICGETTLQSIEGETDRDDWNRDLAKAFAHFVANLHSKGILHNDLNDTNVLFRKDETGDYHFSVIDINRMTFRPLGQPIPDKDCIENLTRFTGRIDLFAFVAREYAAVCGLDTTHWVAKAVRQKDRHDYNWRVRKAVLHPIRHLKKIRKHT